MKKITYTTYKKGDGKNPFFWDPWGWLGCLGRLLAFLLILMIVMWLLNLFRGCSRGGFEKNPRKEFYYPDNPYVHDVTDDSKDAPEQPKYPVPDKTDWPLNIDDPGPYLPSPGDNYIPEYTPDDVITDDGGRQIVGDKLNVILDSDANDETFRRWAEEFKQLYPGAEYSIVFYDPNTKLIQIQVPQQEREQIMENLPQQITDISFIVFPEGLMGPVGEVVSVPNDPIFNYPELDWFFAPIQAYEAWEITTGTPDVKVAIVDSYFDLNHDELNSNRIYNPYSVGKRTADVAPEEGCDPVSFVHGSMVASMALGNQNNYRGSSGIAPNVTFIPVSLGYQCTTMRVLSGVLYSIYQGANVINLSLGADFSEDAHNVPVDMQVAISEQYGLEEQKVWDYVTDLANKRNITFVWAAGNEDVFLRMDPEKRDKFAIRVSGVNEQLAKWEHSNYGNVYQYDTSTISAPSTMIFGAKPYNDYDAGDGTSFAAPLVTGAVALMKSLDPTLSNEEIIQILRETAIPPADGCTTIGPIIQIKDALLKVKENFVNINELLSDHNKLVGLWQSTELLTAYNTEGPTGEMVRQYYEFSNPNSGKGIVYETGSKIDYTANVKVNWFDDHIQFVTGRYMPSAGTKTYIPETVDCYPDKDGLLLAYATNEWKTEPDKPFYLKKVNSRLNE